MRSSGIIMHISSLPGKYGIGTLGEEAYKFVDFLVESGQKYWQVLPLNQTSYGDSPYQSCSAFSGNPYFVDLDMLKDEGLLDEEDYLSVDFGDDEEYVDYSKIFKNKLPVLRIAYNNSKGYYTEEIAEFIKEEKKWIEDYGLFMAIKTESGGKSLKDWSLELKERKKESLDKYKEELEDEINFWIFIQYLFFKQWKELKSYANENEIKIIGDIPIYVAEDSVDLWVNPENFNVNKDLIPISVAGCPPDTFSLTGQLWGNPIYNWEKIKEDKYEWWIERIRANLKIYDAIRLDHFRGFESFYEIPYGEKTAENGKWVKGPGIQLFNEIEKKFGNIEIIAEDLGYMTDELIKFRKETGFPGMKVLQFAFNKEEDSEYLPHNYNKNSVVYTGTHDNDTVMGWINESGNLDEVEYAKDYLALTEEEGYNWGFIRGAWGSTANISIALMQDFLGLGSISRMNKPSKLGYWKWRMKEDAISDKLSNKINELTKIYCRIKNN
ncbi:MAG: 4-alpha-glucanotransferase [Clostridiales bacterium]|nr:4-alpha-glucanotransferase [Clostridiales bacterium]